MCILLGGGPISPGLWDKRMFANADGEKKKRVLAGGRILRIVGTQRNTPYINRKSYFNGVIHTGQLYPTLVGIRASMPARQID